MNNAHRKTLAAVFADPIDGNLEWGRIEALLMAAGCTRIEGSGSSVTFEKNGAKVFFHRPIRIRKRCATGSRMQEPFYNASE